MKTKKIHRWTIRKTEVDLMPHIVKVIAQVSIKHFSQKMKTQIIWQIRKEILGLKL